MQKHSFENPKSHPFNVSSGNSMLFEINNKLIKHSYFWGYGKFLLRLIGSAMIKCNLPGYTCWARPTVIFGTPKDDSL